ncbi:monovalent cation/H(+) antiporter subunit G [Alkalicaulis satelles]|uniref:Monovalent cation/H(+) antiporter subunit G n=1 Tax=Alkalicaulis satelles TaxID=2609175 RepID=A0A5M6ZQH5_9PROT|nr:monovalent cation/H(+) antiporter subunit G [Alkalicaulis satelles]KAA5804511.1 monovalent cation/H(+) antiporter subunit G [Alkalicaulis satelles]
MDWMGLVQLAVILVSAALMLTGAGIILAGAVGVIRLPDFYTRMHAAGVTDTLGAEIIILGLILQAGFTLVSVKLALLGLIIFLTSPTSTHAVANAAYRSGLKPILRRWRSDENRGDAA